MTGGTGWGGETIWHLKLLLEFNLRFVSIGNFYLQQVALAGVVKQFGRYSPQTQKLEQQRLVQQ